MTCCQPQMVCFPITPIPPPPIIPSTGLRGPIIGDTSGNAAQPGMVGEFIQRSMTGTVTVATNAFLVTTITPMTLGPGDWDLDAKLDVSALFTAAQFVLNPVIPSFSSNMLSAGYLPAVVHQIASFSIVSLRTQFMTASAATILQFDITTSNFTAASVTGNYTFTVNARRVR